MFFILPIFFNIPHIMPQIITLIYIWQNSTGAMPKASNSDITAICLNGNDVTA